MLSWKITTCVTVIVHSFFCLVEHPTIYHSLGRLGCREGDRHPQQEGAQKDIGQLFRETSTLPRWKAGSCRRCPGWWPTSWSAWTTGRDWFGSVWYGWIGIGLGYMIFWSGQTRLAETCLKYCCDLFESKTAGSFTSPTGCTEMWDSTTSQTPGFINPPHTGTNPRPPPTLKKELSTKRGLWTNI